MKALYLRLHEDRDKDLIKWLEALDDLPYGAKSQAIKEALRRGIDNRTTSAPANVTLDADAVREAVTNAIAQSLDLAKIRRVVEAGVTSALASARVSVVKEGNEEGEDESEAFLSTLGEELLM